MSRPQPHAHKTLVVGANGQIGRQLIGMMALAGLPVVAMIRDPQQAEALSKLGAETIIGDLSQPLSLDLLAGCNQVVFTAGSGGHTGADQTILIDLWGACQFIDLVKQSAHIDHFVMISARDAGDPENGNPVIKPYNVCKHFADHHLIDSQLHYSILRPGRLTDAPATGLISTQRPEDKTQQTISRIDVAACIVHCLQHPTKQPAIFELYSGDTPITSALTC
jgi:uncharacterized protein YbjT (DUF2867 family)